MASSFELDDIPRRSGTVKEGLRLAGTSEYEEGGDEDESIDERARFLAGEDREEHVGDGVGVLKEKESEDEESEGYLQLIARIVPTTDDPTLPSLTFRAMFLGTLFVIMGSTASTIFYFKSNPPSFSSYFVILSSYPLGNFLAAVLPSRAIFGIDLNPGPFNVKEHLLIGVIASSGGSAAYASDILAILTLFYKTDLSPIASITLLLTTQLIGFGLSGMIQNLLVKPLSMFWPNALVIVTLFQTLHAKGATRNGDIITKQRLRFFLMVFGTCFAYQFIPAFIFPTLASVPILCLVTSPKTPAVLKTLGSGYSGLGLLDFSFDWGAVGAQGPLYTPWWALCNWFGGICIMMWIVVPILYFGNVWDAKSFPSPVSAALFNKNFEHFDVNSILAPDLSLNQTAWETQRPLLLTPYFAISYSLSFAALTSVITHVFLYHSKEIKEAISGRGQHNDVHNTLMRAYPEVSKRVYMAMLLINLLAAAILVKTTPLQTPLWALFLALFIAMVFLIPIGIVAASSGTTIGLNVITEFIIGLLNPGKPIGNVFFKCFGYMCMSQALGLTEDLKLAFYLKVPYRKMFIAQVYGTVIGCFVNYITLVSIIAAKRPFFDGSVEDPSGQWTARGPHIFFSASVIWGLVAPARFFAGKYALLYLGFPLGIAVPLVFYALHKRYPQIPFNKVVFPIVCSGATQVPQIPTNVILTSFILAFVFHRIISKKYSQWTEKYSLTLSAALDAATSLNAMSIYFFFTVLLGGWAFPEWWGNSSIDTEHCTPGS